MPPTETGLSTRAEIWLLAVLAVPSIVGLFGVWMGWA
jgi:hypothetical protein